MLYPKNVIPIIIKAIVTGMNPTISVIILGKELVTTETKKLTRP